MHADHLLRAAKPVVDRLGADLGGADTGVVLSDAEARVVALSAASAWQRRELDALGLAPGRDHLTDAPPGMAMASAPVKDPRTGQLLGAVSLVCRVASANSLL